MHFAAPEAAETAAWSDLWPCLGPICQQLVQPAFAADVRVQRQKAPQLVASVLAVAFVLCPMFLSGSAHPIQDRQYESQQVSHEGFEHFA